MAGAGRDLAAMIVRLKERGEQDLDPEVWQELYAQADFWRLVQSKILSVSNVNRATVRLRGNCYVGRAVISGVTLEITEKVAGAVESLFSFSTNQSFRTEKVEGQTTDLGPLASLIVRQYLYELNRYVSSGRESVYAKHRFQGSLVGGRLDVHRTIHLRARGLRQVLAFERNVLVRNTLKNRTLLASLREIERLANVIDLAPDQLARARALSMIFEDCRDAEVLFASRGLFRSYAERLAEESHSDRDLLTLAAVLLAHQSFEPSHEILGIVPRTWFLNLETLFETAVRRALGKVSGLIVTKGALHNRHIFTTETDFYRANPDLVISENDHVIAVGDVKYKEWDRRASEDDLYQLLVHTAALGAPLAFLVFPHDKFEALNLGTASTGAATWVFGVSLLDLENDLLQLLSTMKCLKLEAV